MVREGERETGRGTIRDNERDGAREEEREIGDQSTKRKELTAKTPTEP